MSDHLERLERLTGYSIYADFHPRIEYKGGENLYRWYKEKAPGARPVLIHQPLGNVWVASEFMTRRLGILTLTSLQREIEGDKTPSVPLPITDGTKMLGVARAPETVCFPFKAILGYYFETARKFEELKGKSEKNLYPFFLSHESTGYCRERVYGRAEEAHLQDFYQKEFGHVNFDFYIVRESLKGVLEFLSLLHQLSGKSNWELIQLLNEGIRRLDLTERFEREVRYTQSLTADFHQAERILTQAKDTIAMGALSISQVKDILKSHHRNLKNLPKVRKRPRGVIALTGEIFHCEEIGSSSFAIDEELVKRGYYFEKTVGVGHYTPRFELTLERLTQWLLGRVNPFQRNKTREMAAQAGLKYDAGGHSVDTAALIGEIEERKKRNQESFDGVIELLPFGCQPQIMVANVIPIKNFPYLRLLFDEQTGQGGVSTRLEAFLEMIERQKATTQKRPVV